MENNTKKWVRMKSGAEYSPDFNFFIENQIILMSSKNGTSFVSCLDGQVFLRIGRRDMSRDFKIDLCRSIHREIFDLRHGGELVD